MELLHFIIYDGPSGPIIFNSSATPMVADKEFCQEQLYWLLQYDPMGDPADLRLVEGASRNGKLFLPTDWRQTAPRISRILAEIELDETNENFGTRTLADVLNS